MKLAIFDFDGTLVNSETLPFMIKAWGKLGYSKMKQFMVIFKIGLYLIVYKIGLKKSFDKQMFRTKAMYIFLELFDDMNEDEINTFFNQCFDLMHDQFNTKVVTELTTSRDEGFRTVLLSGCYTPFIDIVGRYYGFDFVFGSPINYSEQGYINHTNPVDVTMGDKKVDIITTNFDKSTIDWSSSKAYGDSYYDIDILSKVGIPIAVNPDDQLKEIAVTNSWSII